MDASTSLQIPNNDWSQGGPSSSSRPNRPASAAVANSMPPPSSKKRASHSVTATQNQPQEEASTSAYRDVYAHPAAVAFAAAHPRRTIPKFGPYLLLQTLGEGEFGKVKLGLHGQWGEEVAVKLIRRGNVDNPLRMSKVEREIEVLRTIQHPNIVRLYDVIETDKYIGIILEYASGGELFDHILAHRYLKEKDACKLFAQLISGVSYIHAKKIVHRDLKLENLLLDRNRNVIITDFGFANRFEHRADDLMQTSCGSPCYAAPELVISEGLYVGSAVDIWSCGVILYAMLAGYLPFDDDPANPEGDNINLLYKYIVNTPLTFPDYVSPDARDLLSMMLVPDPKRRSGLPEIKSHRWLAPYSQLFSRTVPELEHIALEQQNLKRQAYQRQMRSHAAEQQREREQGKMSRNASSRHQEFLYDSSVQDLPNVTPQTQRRAVASAIVMGSSAAQDEDEVSSPTVPPTSPDEVDMQGAARGEPRSRRSKSKESSRSKQSQKEKQPSTPKSPEKDAAGTGSRRKKGGYRHTVQLEYPDDDAQPPTQAQPQAQSPPKPPQDVDMVYVSDAISPSYKAFPESPTAIQPSTPRSVRKPPVDLVEKVFASPNSQAGRSVPASAQTPSRMEAEPANPGSLPKRAQSVEPAIEVAHPKTDSGSTGSGGSRHRRGISMDKFGFGKKNTSSVSENESAPTKLPSTFLGKRPSVQMDEKTQIQSDIVGKAGSVKGTNKGKSRRKTLSLMVEPLSRSIKDRTKNRSVTVDTSSKSKSKDQESAHEVEVDVTPISTSVPPVSAPSEPSIVSTPTTAFRPFKDMQRSESTGISSLSAKSVMSWFRSRSLSKRESEAVAPAVLPPTFEMVEKPHIPTMTSSSSSVGQVPVQVIVTTPNNQAAEPPTAERKWARSPSESGGARFANLMRNVTGVGATSGVAASSAKRGKFDNTSLRIHHGAVDQATVTSGAPPEVFAHVTKVLLGMGLEVQKENDFKYRCIRPKKPKSTSGKDGFGRQASDAGSGYTAFTMVGSAASNGVDKRGLPVPSHTSFGTGGMLRGLLMRRQSSQVSNHTPTAVAPPSAPSASFETDPDLILPDTSAASTLPDPLPAGAVVSEPLYGDRVVDQGDEVRFSVELTRIDRLEDTLSLDIRRLKGNLRSYKFLYDTLRERCDFAR